jgi:hypothetical protein
MGFIELLFIEFRKEVIWKSHANPFALWEIPCIHKSVYVSGCRSPPAPLKKGGEFSSSPFLRGIEGDH